MSALTSLEQYETDRSQEVSPLDDAEEPPPPVVKIEPSASPPPPLEGAGAASPSAAAPPPARVLSFPFHKDMPPFLCGHFISTGGASSKQKFDVRVNPWRQWKVVPVSIAASKLRSAQRACNIAIALSIELHIHSIYGQYVV